MKTKLSRIMGVGLALILVLTLAFAIVPAKEAEAALGEQLWLAQAIPTGVPTNAAGYFKLGIGTDVAEYVIAADGVTMYAIDGAALLNAAGAVLKSPGAGMFWTALPAIAGAAAIPITNIALSPTNSNVLAVTGGGNTSGAGLLDEAWITTDGGATWTQLPATTGQTMAERFMDIKVGPDRTGTIYGRDYILATSDNAVNTVARGSLLIIGASATWTNVLAAGTEDFTSCEFSPNFVGDRCVLGIGSTAAVTNLRTYNCTNYPTLAPALLHGAASIIPLTGAGGAITDYDGAGAATHIWISDIALPTNYDVTTPGLERAFVTTNNVTVARDNVWRCDGILAAQSLMQAGAGAVGWRSIAYAGDVLSGRLFVGNWLASAAPATAIDTQVWYTDQAQTNLPVWYPSFKPPTGNSGVGVGGRAYVRCSPTDSSTVYCGTTGNNESAFSRSVDGGVTYDQISLVDQGVGLTTVVKIDALSLTADGGILFMATDDGAQLSLWKTATPPDPYGWTRIFCFTQAIPGAAGVLAINPGWADAPEIYFAETPTVANRFFASVDGGAIFSGYTAPVIGSPLANATLRVESSRKLYLGFTNAANVYSSSNGGQVWTPPASAAVAAVVSLAAPGNGVVLVGGIGSVSVSTDSAVNFVPQPITGLPAANLYILADEDFATNSVVYAGDMAAGPVYRFTVGVDALWVNMANPTAVAVVSMGMTNGTLYAISAAACDRTLDPSATIGTLSWGIMDSPAAVIAAVAHFAVASNKLYAANAVATLWGYDDQMATAKTTVTAPASGTVVPVDPVGGRGLNTTIAWTAMGTGQGLCTNYDVYIFDTAAPTAGTTFGRVIVAGAVVADTSVAVAPPFRTAPSTDTATLAFVLRGGTEYGIMVRASAQVGTVNVVGDRGQYSNWSDPVIFTVEPSTGAITPPHAGPILQSPPPGAQNVRPDAAFSWAPMSGVTEYELIIALDAALTQPVAGTPVVLGTTAYGPVDLEYNTDYYYAVRAVTPTSSVQSIGAFRTMVSPEEEAPPVVVAPEVVSPAWIWAVVIIGALLVIAVIFLIVRTRRA